MSLPPKVAFECLERTLQWCPAGARSPSCDAQGSPMRWWFLFSQGWPTTHLLDQLSKVWGESYIRNRIVRYFDGCLTEVTPSLYAPVFPAYALAGLDVARMQVYACGGGGRVSPECVEALANLYDNQSKWSSRPTSIGGKAKGLEPLGAGPRPG